MRQWRNGSGVPKVLALADVGKCEVRVLACLTYFIKEVPCGRTFL